MTAGKKLVPRWSGRLQAIGHHLPGAVALPLDHTGNANLFAGATWIVQKAEHDVMFAEKPPADHAAGHLQRAQDRQDQGPERRRLRRVRRRPGGHQVDAGTHTRSSRMLVKLAKFGPVILSGDLYHYPEEIATGKTPDFEFNPGGSRRRAARRCRRGRSSRTPSCGSNTTSRPTPNLPKSPKLPRSRTGGTRVRQVGRVREPTYQSYPSCLSYLP